MVQDTISYAAAASHLCGPSGVEAEMTSPQNTAACHLESEPGFARNCVRMSAFGREYRHPNNIMPERPLSAVFAVNQTSEYSVREIFQELQNIGIPSHGVRCLQRASKNHLDITFGRNYAFIFEFFCQKSSRIGPFYGRVVYTSK